jgi:hypothetical protein
MSKILTPESVATRPDASYFSPERLEMLKQIFESVCNEENIVSKEHRDDLAFKLLMASKSTDDEGTLIAAMKRAIAGYRK